MENAPLSTFAPNLFAGRTALITGGGRGIGREIALAFAGLGADVIIASRNPENLAATAKDIEALGRRCLAQVTNVRKPEDVDNWIQDNVTDLASAKVVLRTLAYVVALLARERLKQ
jgi:NAD(P)-dependent dehydrogenase (short-subunit alcohol dehydrogenase family)